jgi:hypothetical protein
MVIGWVEGPGPRAYSGGLPRLWPGGRGGGWSGCGSDPHRGGIGAVWAVGGFRIVRSVSHRLVSVWIVGSGQIGESWIRSKPPINRRVDLRGLSVEGVLDEPRSLSHWRRSGVICCRVTGFPAVTKLVGYLLLHYLSLARLASPPRSPGFILLDCVKLNVELT